MYNQISVEEIDNAILHLRQAKTAKLQVQRAEARLANAQDRVTKASAAEYEAERKAIENLPPVVEIFDSAVFYNSLDAEEKNRWSNGGMKSVESLRAYRADSPRRELEGYRKMQERMMAEGYRWVKGGVQTEQTGCEVLTATPTPEETVDLETGNITTVTPTDEAILDDGVKLLEANASLEFDTAWAQKVLEKYEGKSPKAATALLKILKAQQILKAAEPEQPEEAFDKGVEMLVSLKDEQTVAAAQTMDPLPEKEPIQGQKLREQYVAEFITLHDLPFPQTLEGVKSLYFQVKEVGEKMRGFPYAQDAITGKVEDYQQELANWCIDHEPGILAMDAIWGKVIPVPEGHREGKFTIIVEMPHHLYLPYLGDISFWNKSYAIPFDRYHWDDLGGHHKRTHHPKLGSTFTVELDGVRVVYLTKRHVIEVQLIEGTTIRVSGRYINDVVGTLRVATSPCDIVHALGLATTKEDLWKLVYDLAPDGDLREKAHGEMSGYDQLAAHGRKMQAAGLLPVS